MKPIAFTAIALITCLILSLSDNELKAQDDFGVLSIIAPSTSTTLIVGNAYTVRVRLKNHTSLTGSTLLQVHFSIDGGFPVFDLVSWAYDPNEVMVHTFTDQYVVEELGGAASACIQTPDMNPANDCKTAQYSIEEPAPPPPPPPPVGTNEPVAPATFAVYNPTTRSVSISGIEKCGAAQFRLITVSGHEVVSLKAIACSGPNGGVAQLPNLATGCYILQVAENGDPTVNRKLFLH